jgi:guanine nucleotide-binding protein G(o) subunit alpha
MKIIHQHGYTEHELSEFKSVIFTNTIQSLVKLIRAMPTLNIEFNEGNRKEREQDIARVLYALEHRSDGEQFQPELVLNMKRLWHDPAIQACFKRANEFQLNDSAQYFLDQLDRISALNYLPTEQDILRARLQTTGIVEIKFSTKDMFFRVFDVGGQRSERRKWIHCFENVNAIIFCAALSEYDQMLAEDATMNRMTESLHLFETIFNNRFFVKTSFILFLNKRDLFEEKIKHSPLTACFPEYDGPNEFKPAALYIERQFRSIKISEGNDIYSHLTCATDTQNVQFVLYAVTDMIVIKNLAGSGLY